jgi:hypothetical protein
MPPPRGRPGKIRRALAVHTKGYLPFAFRPVHCGIGGGIDDHLGLKSTHLDRHRFGFPNIQFRRTQGQQLHFDRLAALQFPTQLAVTADEQNPHEYNSASASETPTRSLAESRGAF